MSIYQVPVLDGEFHMKLAGGFVISGPLSLVMKHSMLNNSVLLSEKELKQWFLKAVEVKFPFFQKEQVFVIQPPQAGEAEGEYIVIDYIQPTYGLSVRVRVQIEPTGHDAITLDPRVLDELLEKRITQQVQLIYS